VVRPSSKTVVIAAKAGRLGNRLFLSAYFMANALARGYRLMNPALGEYAPLFEGSSRDPWCRFPDRSSGLDSEVAAQCRDLCTGFLMPLIRFLPAGRLLDIRTTHDAFDSVYDLNGDDFRRFLNRGGMTFVKGWKFRDDRNLVSSHRAIAEYFTPVGQIRMKAEERLGMARSYGDVVIGVHIRQGDYRDWKGGVHYFETEQYAHWMREAATHYQGRKVSFLICSSDPVDNCKFGDLAVTAGPGEAVADLHALSLCDAIMGPPSTFSTWASYHGRKPLCMLQHHRQVVRAEDFLLHDRV
jgi:Glycosyl transferase family 11